MFRGVFRREEDPVSWQEATKAFPNGVPRFDTKEDAKAFTEAHCQETVDGPEPGFQHSISLFTSWEQIETHVIPRIHEYDRSLSTPNAIHDIDLASNRFHSSSPENPGHKILDHIRSRLSLDIHENIMPIASAMNTLKYLFFHMKCGIFVMIRNSQVVMFCPFSNKDYSNTWNGFPELDSIDGSIDGYYAEKRKSYRYEHVIDKSKWWANGNIICNEFDSQGWGDHFNFQLKDMICEVCNQRNVPDCEFFINKRDYPQLKYSPEMRIPVEPYGFIFNKDDTDPSQDIPLTDQLYGSYAPILSFYSSDRFSDILFPPSEDWEAATGKVYPASFKHEFVNGELQVSAPRDLFTTTNLRKFEKPWEEKIPIAFFRGSATGGGTTVETNQRLHLSHLSYVWSSDPQKNGRVPVEGDPNSSHAYLDAKIVRWNMRDKKIAQSKMTFLKQADFAHFGDVRNNFVEIYKQSTYKYLIYVEGHCAACRYGFMMLLDSVILKVESRCVAKEMWYFPLLKPYIDHVPVKADLSDLAEQIEWCRSHDSQCKEIAANARRLYQEMICREGILDYLQSIFVEIARRQIRLPSWAENPSQMEVAPTCRARVGAFCDDEDYCLACKRRQEARKREQRTRDEASSAEVSKKQEIEDLKKRKKQEKIEEFNRKRRLLEENK